MRNFYKLPVNLPNVPLMTEIMRRRDELFSGSDKAAVIPDDAKRMALGILQITNGSAVALPSLQWMIHDSKDVWPPNPDNHYLVILSGQIMCMVNDECPAMNASEAWWVDNKSEAILINKSGDDAILLHVFVKSG